MTDSERSEHSECDGCKAIMGSMMWAFSYATNKGGKVICTACGKSYNSHPHGAEGQITSSIGDQS